MPYVLRSMLRGSVFAGMAGGIAGFLGTGFGDGFVPGAIIGGIVALLSGSNVGPENVPVIGTKSFYIESMLGGVVGSVVADAGYLGAFVGCGIGTVLMMATQSFVIGSAFREELSSTAKNVIEPTASKRKVATATTEQTQVKTASIPAAPTIPDSSADLIRETHQQEEERLAREEEGDDLGFFEQALDEIENDKKHKGIWAKAYAESNDDKQAEKCYIKLRAGYLAKEEAARASEEAQRIEQEMQAAREEGERLVRDEEKRLARVEEERLAQAEQIRERNDYDCIQIALRVKKHFLSVGVFSPGYKITQPSGEKVHLKTFSELQEYYDKHK